MKGTNMKKLFSSLILCAVITVSNLTISNAFFEDYNYNQEVKIFVDYKNYNIPKKNNENPKVIEQTPDDVNKEYRFAIGEPYNLGIRIPQNSDVRVDSYNAEDGKFYIYGINYGKTQIAISPITLNENITSIDQFLKRMGVYNGYTLREIGFKDISKIKWTSKYLKNAAKIYKADSKYVDIAAIQDLNNNYYVVMVYSGGDPVNHKIMNRFLSGMEFYSANQPIKYINRKDSATYRNYIKKTGKIDNNKDSSKENIYELDKSINQPSYTEVSDKNIQNYNSYEQYEELANSNYETYSKPQDNDGDTFRSQYDYIGEFSDGLALAKKKGEKYCVYIDMNGIPVITIPKMYYGSKFKNGIAEICIDGITEKYIDNIYDPTFFINTKGEFVENPTTELNPFL